MDQLKSCEPYWLTGLRCQNCNTLIAFESENVYEIFGDGNNKCPKCNDCTKFDAVDLKHMDPSVVRNGAYIKNEFISYLLVNKDKADNVNHPKHYTSHPSGVECITITRHMSFNVGNAIKYLWRADEKGNAIEDLEKAMWYIKDEIQFRIDCKNGKYAKGKNRNE